MIKLAKPYIPDKSIDLATEVLKSGNLVQGKYVAEFEKQLSNYIDIKYAIVVSSGTAALHLSLLALDIKKGDEVILPAFTFPATINVVEVIGAKPILVDIKHDDYCINIEKIEEKITKATKAIIPVHEFGQSADITKIMDIANHYKLKIIEDAACALGTRFQDKHVGTFGDLGCFSFHPRKAITTGEGGLVTTNNKLLANKIISQRNHGISQQNHTVDFHNIGLNYRMTDFQAAIGIPQLEQFDEIINIRNTIANNYNNHLLNNPYIKSPNKYANRKATFQTYHILIDDKYERDVIKQKLKEQQIETNLGAQALNCLPYYQKKYNWKQEEYPNARYAYKQGLALPIGDHINDKDVEYIATTLNKILK